jgi:succinoglycan biosynthesis protein ExoO
MMVAVSVVMPVYNAANTLRAAVASALDQSLREIELIAVDDCSTDASVELLQEMAAGDDRLRIIRRTANGGPAASRNDGIDAAQGRWIALLDSDDAFLPGRLERLVSIGETGGCELVADNLVLTDAATGRRMGLAVGPDLWPRPQEVSAAALALNDRPSAGAGRQFGYLKPLVRRDFLNEKGIRYRRDISCGEDFDIYMRCLLAGGRMQLDPEPGYLYSISMASHSFDPAKRMRNVIDTGRSNDLLLADAVRTGDRAAQAALNRRRADIDFTRGRLELADALQRRRWSALPGALLRLGGVPLEVGRYIKNKLRHALGHPPAHAAGEGTSAP